MEDVSLSGVANSFDVDIERAENSPSSNIKNCEGILNMKEIDAFVD